MGIFYVLLGALLVSISNFCLRRSIDAGGSSRAYLVVQVAFSFFVMIVLNPIRTGNYAWGWPAVSLGLVGGLIFGILMWGVGKTLEKGPAGLSFAFLNTASVVPAIFLALLFGMQYGHTYTLWNGAGSFLIAAGLFWAGWSSEQNYNRTVWLSFAALIFLFHAIFLVFLQWWAMILRPDLPLSSLVPFHIESGNIQWFMPTVLFVAALIQCVIYAMKERRVPSGQEVYYGILGGITNGACTFFLILAPQKAFAWENAMLFPIFSVAVILICNAWAQILYQEKVNWKANALCVVGVIIGTVAWSSL